MTLRHKILWACSPLLSALMIVSAIAIVASLRLGRAPANILDANIRTIEAAHDMYGAMDDLERDASSHLLLGRAPDRALRRAATERFEEALRLVLGNVTEAGEQQATTELSLAWRRYRRALDSAAPGRGEALAELASAHADIHRSLGAVVHMNRMAMRRRADAAHASATRSAAIMLIVAFAALGTALLVTGHWLRRLLLPLKVVDRGVRSLAAGDFEERLEVDSEDEIGTLAQSFNEMADHLAAYRNSSLGEVMRARHRLEAVMDSLSDAVVLYDLDRTPLLANEAASSLVPKGWDARIEHLPAPLAAAVTKAFDLAVADLEPHLPASVDAAIELPGGEHGRWWLVASHPVTGVSGAVEGVTIALRDVSRARRAADFRGDLVASAAHELRTPLTSLSMAVSLCLEQVPGPLNPRQGQLLDGAREDCARLEGLVDELLDLARLEAGAVRLELEDVPAGALVEQARSRFEPRFEELGVRPERRVSSDLPVRADPERVSRVFDNLIDNALRHAAGAIELGCRDDGDAVRFWVRDFGPGIPDELHDHVFEKFVRVPGTPKRGTGLGLSIVRDVVQAHGGRCGVESPAGGGACFWLTLPKAG